MVASNSINRTARPLRIRPVHNLPFGCTAGAAFVIESIPFLLTYRSWFQSDEGAFNARLPAPHSLTPFWPARGGALARECCESEKQPARTLVSLRSGDRASSTDRRARLEAGDKT